MPRAAAAPGLAHALAQAETFADVHAEAMRVWKRAQSLASELHASQASYAADRERLQQWVSRLEGERGWREEQAKGWMEKVAQLERALAQQAAWGDALRTDLAWAREQGERWEARVGELEGVVRERDAWMQTLRADGEWHKSQALAWQRKVDEAESVARDASTFAQTLQTQLAQLQREKDWLADHREKIEAQLRLLRGEQVVEVSPPPSP
jgi:chromosome segregation ATPase